jgi:hypothetical protein
MSGANDTFPIDPEIIVKSVSLMVSNLPEQVLETEDRPNESHWDLGRKPFK